MYKVYVIYKLHKIFQNSELSRYLTIASLEPANTHRHPGFKALNYKVLDTNTFTIISRFQTHEKKKASHQSFQVAAKDPQMLEN